MMLLIFGFRPFFTALATVVFVCNFCGQNVAQQVFKQTNRFTLFFIPLFSTSTKYYVECSNCGGTTELTREQVDNMERRGLAQR